ncbi:hypothetical protein QCA50_010084 [Cerrena zonata]|uniref:Protein kinase domain-containing protein n=1 Tax=Cerrena zonata TaxID=2478898 RepID=A0AAW0G9C5_9APHY
MATLIKYIKGEPAWKYTALDSEDDENEPHPASEFQQAETPGNDTWYSHYIHTGKNKDELAPLVRKLSEHFGKIPDPIYVHLSSTGPRIPKRGGHYTALCKGTLNGRIVAVKFMRTFKDIELHTQRWNNAEFAHKIRIWHGLTRHENILELLGVDVTHAFLRPNVVVPWVENGNVREYMKKLKSPVSRDQKNAWILQTANGLNYLHLQSIIHGNVRGSNVMINDNGIAQLTDLYLFVHRTKALTGGPLRRMASDESKPQLWMAPELLYKSTIYDRSTKSDVYSFAILCCEIYTEKDPLEKQSADAIHDSRRPPQPLLPTPMEDALFQSVVKECWYIEPNYRPNMARVVRQLQNML